MSAHYFCVPGRADTQVRPVKKIEDDDEDEDDYEGS